MGGWKICCFTSGTVNLTDEPLAFFWGGGGGGRLGALYQVLPALGADHFTFDGEGGGGRFLSAQEFFFILIDKADIETM